MTRVVLNLSGLKRLQRNLAGATENAVRALAFEGEGYIKASFGASPSSPGEPPGVDTGKLRNSIRAEREATARWAITTDTEYAAYLEFGTSRMAARPFMGPALDYLAEEAPRFFRGFLEKSI